MFTDEQGFGHIPTSVTQSRVDELNFRPFLTPSLHVFKKIIWNMNMFIFSLQILLCEGAVGTI